MSSGSTGRGTPPEVRAGGLRVEPCGGTLSCVSRQLPLLELLGVSVRIRCADAELRQRLATSYARSLAAGAARAPLEAALEAAGDDWLVRVEGRGEQRARERGAALRAFHHELLHGVMLRAPELYYVHAAVVALDGRAVVLPGLSRAGKSTLALALVERGARFLSDELLAFDPARELALAFPRAPKIRDECAGYFPRLADAWIGSGEARVAPFEAFAADLVLASAPVRAIVSPRWSAPEERPSGPLDSCRPVRAGEALLDLSSSSLNFGTHGARSLDCLTRLVAQAACARLDWRDPHAAARSIEGLLAAGAR